MVSNKLFNECLWADLGDILAPVLPVTKTAMGISRLMLEIETIHAECYPAA